MNESSRRPVLRGPVFGNAAFLYNRVVGAY